jgi:hypothetical protein
LHCFFCLKLFPWCPLKCVRIHFFSFLPFPLLTRGFPGKWDKVNEGGY